MVDLLTTYRQMLHVTRGCQWRCLAINVSQATKSRNLEALSDGFPHEHEVRTTMVISQSVFGFVCEVLLKQNVIFPCFIFPYFHDCKSELFSHVAMESLLSVTSNQTKPIRSWWSRQARFLTVKNLNNKGGFFLSLL